MPQKSLHDGTLVDTSSEEWRHETEARAILAMPRLIDRRRQLQLVEQRRGEAERLRLQKTMMALFMQRRQNNETSGT